MERLHETSGHLQDDEKNQISAIGVLATEPIAENTEYGGTDRTQHQGQRDAPCDIRWLVSKGFRNRGNGQGDTEKVKRILSSDYMEGKYPSPAKETKEEEIPLSPVEKHETFDGVHGYFTGWLQREDLMFNVKREVLDLLSHRHFVDSWSRWIFLCCHNEQNLELKMHEEEIRIYSRGRLIF
jgi:hypothetical protein